MVFTERDKRKKYNDIFEKRFNKETGLSTTKEDPEFFTDYVNKIFDEYKDIITKKRNSNDNNYIKREKIRLKANLKNLEKENFEYSHLVSVITILITIIVAGNNQLYSISSTIANVTHNVSNANNIENLIIKNTIGLAILIVAGIFFIIIINEQIKKYCDRLIAFNRMCLEVLDNFQNELML